MLTFIGSKTILFERPNEPFRRGHVLLPNNVVAFLQRELRHSISIWRITQYPHSCQEVLEHMIREKVNPWFDPYVLLSLCQEGGIISLVYASGVEKVITFSRINGVTHVIVINRKGSSLEISHIAPMSQVTDMFSCSVLAH